MIRMIFLSRLPALLALMLMSVAVGSPSSWGDALRQPNRIQGIPQSGSLAFFTWPENSKTKGKDNAGNEVIMVSTSGIQESRLRGGAESGKGGVEVVLGPTTRPLSQAFKSAVSAISSQFGMSVKKEEPAAGLAGQPGALSEYICMLQAQETALLQQAAQCRAAAQRLIFLQQLLYTKVYGKNSEPHNREELELEVGRWKAAALGMHRSLDRCFISSGKDLAILLGEKPPSLPAFASLKSEELQAVLDSAVTPEQYSEEDSVVLAKRAAGPTVTVAGPTTGAIDKMRLTSVQYFTPEVEGRYRVGTWCNIPVYGACPDSSKTVFEYPGDTELHLVWDIDQTKLAGEGTNDVELVIKCALWWKEELKHDKGFIPAAVPEAGADAEQIKKEFREYCDQFDIYKAFREVIPLLLRPRIREFVRQHPQARWWSFTNKDREVEGKIVRDVSDEDGLVGEFQPAPHEVSGEQVLDPNKYVLRVLEQCANEYAGMVIEERPIIGVRGQTKNLERVAQLIKEKRQQRGEPLSRPVTIVLIDDRKQDAYGKCQANDERSLCHVSPFSAITPEQGEALTAVIEKILPSEKLLRFYQAFKQADPNHALIQCVEILSDDQSQLLKRVGSDATMRFEYRPRTAANLNLTPLPVFKRSVCRTA